MTATSAATECQQVIDLWYQKNNDAVQRIIGSMIRRKGHHGEGPDEMRAELNYWVFRHVMSAARRGTIAKVVLSMTVDYAYRSWATGKRSYQDRQGRHDLADEVPAMHLAGEWQFPLSKRPNDPARLARYHLDMQTIGSRLTPRARSVLREFIRNSHASDRHVCEALGEGWRPQYVCACRHAIKMALLEAGYGPPSKRRVHAPPEVRAIGHTVACVYDACQRTPRASYVSIARRLGCQKSAVRWALRRFMEMGVPWADEFVANNSCAPRKRASQPSCPTSAGP